MPDSVEPVDLSFVYAMHANFTRANLRGADLTRAKLTGANLTGADIDVAGINLFTIQGKACHLP
jgi:uncharacterized protein YjbI with pentapeptide repeats